jgi:hypothetical protein
MTGSSDGSVSLLLCGFNTKVRLNQDAKGKKQANTAFQALNEVTKRNFIATWCFRLLVDITSFCYLLKFTTA